MITRGDRIIGLGTQFLVWAIAEGMPAEDTLLALKVTMRMFEWKAKNPAVDPAMMLRQIQRTVREEIAMAQNTPGATS